MTIKALPRLWRQRPRYAELLMSRMGGQRLSRSKPRLLGVFTGTGSHAFKPTLFSKVTIAELFLEGYLGLNRSPLILSRILVTFSKSRDLNKNNWEKLWTCVQQVSWALALCWVVTQGTGTGQSPADPSSPELTVRMTPAATH